MKSILKKGDILIIVSVIMASLIWFIGDFSRDSEDKTVIIRRHGEICHSISLSSVADREEYTIGSCLIEVLPDAVSFLSSDCSDGLCVKRGAMTRVGDVMACVPEGVTVEIVSAVNEFDGISY